MFRRRIAVTIIFAGLGFGGAGCGHPNGHVSGSVVFDGQPLAGGRVTFVCEGQGRPIIESWIEYGEYAISNAPVGPAKVIVETFKPQPKPPEGVDPVTGIDYSVGWVDTGPYVPIPKRYAIPEKSGLTCTIVPGPQTFDIALTK